MNYSAWYVGPPAVQMEPGQLSSPPGGSLQASTLTHLLAITLILPLIQPHINLTDNVLPGGFFFLKWKVVRSLPCQHFLCSRLAGDTVCILWLRRLYETSHLFYGEYDLNTRCRVSMYTHTHQDTSCSTVPSFLTRCTCVYL